MWNMNIPKSTGIGFTLHVVLVVSSMAISALVVQGVMKEEIKQADKERSELKQELKDEMAKRERNDKDVIAQMAKTKEEEDQKIDTLGDKYVTLLVNVNNRLATIESVVKANSGGK